MTAKESHMTRNAQDPEENVFWTHSKHDNPYPQLYSGRRQDERLGLESFHSSSCRILLLYKH